MPSSTRSSRNPLGHLTLVRPPCPRPHPASTDSHTRAAQETFIAYVHTLEDQPGSPQRKARFLILAGQSVLPPLPHLGRTSPRSPSTLCYCSSTRWQVQDPQGKAERQRHLLNRQDLGPRRPPARRGRKGAHARVARASESPSSLTTPDSSTQRLVSERMQVRQHTLLAPSPLPPRVFGTDARRTTRSRSSSPSSSTARRTATTPSSPRRTRPSSSSRSSAAGGDTCRVRLRSSLSLRFTPLVPTHTTVSLLHRHWSLPE